MKKLLLEIVSEEIPASMQSVMADKLLKNVLERLSSIFIDKSLTSKPFYTPTRIGFFIYDIPSKALMPKTEIKGPKLTANEIAINGFLNKYNIASVDSLKIINDTYFLVNDSYECDVNQILHKVIEESISSITWPKSMRWGDHEIKWVRPIKSILCLLENEQINIKFGHIISSNITFGHKFLANHKINVGNASIYEQLLRDSYIEIWPHKRQSSIKTGFEQKIKELNIKIIEDEALLSEVANLTEWPISQIGTINQEFLRLPKEVLITTLKKNQKYFLFEDKIGNLAPFFGAVSNMPIIQENKAIILNHQKVVNARLSDAMFFMNNDLKHSLHSRIEYLKNLLFHNKIGTVYDKIQSVKALALKIANQLGCDNEKVTLSADLMKTDLTTEMVKEFPELQGIIGYHYALAEGYDLEIADAIRDQYCPKGPTDRIPNKKISIVISLAEKLDTLNLMFNAGIKPTGSKDPFALRRAAIGVLNIINGNELELNLETLSLSDEVLSFIKQRQNKETI
jgi:glycyl-tRNA synthetase beta chain